jgi:hypothetical protein
LRNPPEHPEPNVATLGAGQAESRSRASRVLAYRPYQYCDEEAAMYRDDDTEVSF